jgi:hypothetical protein
METYKELTEQANAISQHRAIGPALASRACAT